MNTQIHEKIPSDAKVVDDFISTHSPVPGLGYIIDPIVGVDTERMFDGLLRSLGSKMPGPMLLGI